MVISLMDIVQVIDHSLLHPSLNDNDLESGCCFAGVND